MSNKLMYGERGICMRVIKEVREGLGRVGNGEVYAADVSIRMTLREAYYLSEAYEKLLINQEDFELSEDTEIEDY